MALAATCRSLSYFLADTAPPHERPGLRQIGAVHLAAACQRFDRKSDTEIDPSGQS